MHNGMNCSDKTHVFVERLNGTLLNLSILWATSLFCNCITAALSPMPTQEDCTQLTLVSFSSVGCKPTSATEHSVQLDIKSRTTFQL